MTLQDYEQMDARDRDDLILIRSAFEARAERMQKEAARKARGKKRG